MSDELREMSDVMCGCGHEASDHVLGSCNPFRAKCPCLKCDAQVYRDVIARGRKAEEALAEAEEFVVRTCIESRKQPKERQSAFLRDELLTRFDPDMNITHRLKILGAGEEG